MKCLQECKETNTPCKEKKCRMWIDYEQEYNCIGETVFCNGPLTLREVSKRLGVSFVRIKQIEDGALKKIKRLFSKELT